MLVKSGKANAGMVFHLQSTTLSRNFFSKKDHAPLSGAPAIRRMKTYSAQSGYVYQYFYEGQRPLRGAEGGTEFVFSVSADRKTWHPVSVLVGDVVGNCRGQLARRNKVLRVSEGGRRRDRDQHERKHEKLSKKTHRNVLHRSN